MPESLRPADRSVMHAENRELRKKVEDMKVALTTASAKEKHMLALQEEAERQLRRHIANLEYEVQDRELQVHALSTQVRTQQDVISALKGDAASRVGEQEWIQSVADENKDLREQLDTALGALKKARDREASAAGAIHGQDATISHLKHALQACQAESTRWKQRCEDMSSTLEDLKAVIEHTSSENEQLRMFKQHHRAAADMAADIAARQEEVGMWRTRCRLLESQLAEVRGAAAEQTTALQLLADSRLHIIEGLQRDLQAVSASVGGGGEGDGPSRGHREGFDELSPDRGTSDGSPATRPVGSGGVVPSVSGPASTTAMDRLRLDLETAARRLSLQEAELVELRAQLQDARVMNARYQLTLDGVGHPPEDARDHRDDTADDGWHSGDTLCLSEDGSPPRSRGRDGSEQALGADALVRFFKARDDEAEVVFGMVEGLLSSVQGLCAIVTAKLSGDPVPVSLLVQEEKGGAQGRSSGAGAADHLPRHSLQALFRDSEHGQAGGAAMDSSHGLADVLSNRITVVDRGALVQAVNAMVTTAVRLRLEVTEAVATSLGSECAMQ